MSRGSFYRGTNLEQDGRFKNKEKLLLDKMSFPKEFDFKVDLNKVDDVDLKIIKEWINNRLTDILGFEDEFLSNYTISLLEDKNEELDPKKIQIILTGFINRDASLFMKDLWNLLLSAQACAGGIPENLIKEKEEELKKQSDFKFEKLKYLEKMLGEEKNDLKIVENDKNKINTIKELIKSERENVKKIQSKKRKYISSSSSSSLSSSSSSSSSRSRSKSISRSRRKKYHRKDSRKYKSKDKKKSKR